MGAWLVFGVTFAVYALTASPATGFLDAPEFVAASWQLGIAHPPGHPVPVMVGRALAWLPVGDIAFRVNLASSAAMAGAVTVLYATGRELAARVAPGVAAWARVALAAGAALAFAFSWSAWFQGVRAEVYATETLLGLLLVALSLRYLASSDRRPLVAGGLVLGLALASHPFVTLLVGLPLIMVTLWRRPGLKAVGRVALAGVLGLAALAYLPVRAQKNPLPNWGHPDTLDRFAWVVSARAFQKALTREHHTSRAEDAAQVPGVLLEQAVPVVPLVSLLGIYLLARRRFGAEAAALAGVLACVAAGPVLIGFDPDNPDAHGYLLPALAAIFLLLVAALASAAELGRKRRQLAAGIACVAVLLVPLQLVRHAPDADLRHGHASTRITTALLDPLPPRTLLITAFFETAFLVWSARAVDEARPDVTHLDTSFLTYEGMPLSMARRYPELSPLIEAPLRAGAPAPIAQLDALARPVHIELHFNLDPALGPRLVPRGPLAEYRREPPGDHARARGERTDQAIAAGLERVAAGDGADASGARRLLLWYAVNRARHYCEARRLDAAHQALLGAERLAPGDPTLAELAEACGVSGR